MAESVEPVTYDATICISIFYRADECLPILLESILRNPLKHKALQIVVCDDCCPTPKEAMEEVIDRYQDKFGEISYLRHVERKGFRKTVLLQKAIEQATGEVFIFLDGDCVPIGKSVALMIKYAKKGDFLYQGQKVFLFSSSIKWANDHLDEIEDFSVLKEKFYADNTKTRKNKKRARDSFKMQKEGREGRYVMASGNFMALKTEIVKKNGMKSTSGKGHMEDTDFAERLYKGHGIDLWELKGAEVLHLFEHH